MMKFKKRRLGMKANGHFGMIWGRNAAFIRKEPTNMNVEQFVFSATAALACMFLLSANTFAGQQNEATIGLGNWFTVSANLDGGYRRTQLFDPHYNTAVLQWDSRAELWLPPFRSEFSWGPYVRIAGIKGSQSEAWQNAWLGGPGLGFQIYPVSTSRFKTPSSKTGKVLGPLRLFAEYNFTNYWGPENRWRPRNQTRAGFDYWKAINVNDPTRYWWAEIWNGLYWQSANEFTDRYDTVIIANAGRIGVRKPHRGAFSAFTPYIALESSRTKNNQYYWENRLLLGGGVRVSPSLGKLASNNKGWLNRFVVYGEYLNTAAYYTLRAPSSIPRFDVRIGVSASVGDWYK
jgi:hypothetical protein